VTRLTVDPGTQAIQKGYGGSENANDRIGSEQYVSRASFSSIASRLTALGPLSAR
jgi:hypothetical protein